MFARLAVATLLTALLAAFAGSAVFALTDFATRGVVL
jgi:hypothetical protein